MSFDAERLMGVVLPDVALPSTHRGFVNLSHEPGRVLCFVYPYTGKPGLPDPRGWDFIPNAHGSTPQAQAYSESYGAFRMLGVRVYGVSLQDTLWQLEVSTRLQLHVPLLSDESGHWSALLGLPYFTIEEVNYLRRLTFLAERGRIVAVRHPVDPPAGDAQYWLQSLRSM